MKKIHLFLLCSAAFASTVCAENYTVTGGTSETPANFSDANAWGGTLPPFDSTTNVILKGIEGDPQYFNIDQNVTVGSIKTEAGVNGDYYLNASGNKVNIDVAAGSVSDAILFSNGQTKTAVGTLSIDNGTFNIISSSTNGGDFGTTARIATASDNGLSEVTKKIDIGANAVVNAYTKLALSGTIGTHSDINIFGELNTYAAGNKGEGNLIVYWSTNNYGTTGGGGIRTRVNIEDGGVVSTGNMSLMVTSQTNVKAGGTLNVNNTLSWALSTSNSGGVLNTYGTTNINKVNFTPTATGTGAEKINILDGVTTIKTVDQTSYNSSSINVSGGILNVENAYDMGGGELNVSGGTANINNLNQTAGTVYVYGGTANFSGTNTINSSNSFKSDAGSNIVFKSGSVNTLGTSATYGSTKGNVKFEQGSTLNVSGLLNISNGTWNFDGNINSSATGTGNYQTMQFTGGNTKITFGKNSTFTATGGRTWVDSATVTFNSATNSYKTTQFVLNDTSTLQFNGQNSVVSTNGKYETLLNMTLNSKPTLILKGTQQFANALFQGLIRDENRGDDMSKGNDTLAKLTLDFQFENKSDYVAFSYFNHTNGKHADGTAQDYVNIYVKNFENNRLFLTDKDNDGMETFYLIDVDTNEYITYKFDAGTVNGLSGYWVNAVPEPAEWAAIFGAIALGLAIYRRRKA